MRIYQPSTMKAQSLSASTIGTKGKRIQILAFQGSAATPSLVNSIVTSSTQNTLRTKEKQTNCYARFAEKYMNSKNLSIIWISVIG